jgi:thymidylate synthase (FAD)
MSVKLVAISKGVDDAFSAEDLIAYCARVSNPTNQLNVETAPKLLKYLVAHHHWSPFEMVSMTLEIKTTRDIARQILRHRSFSFQEFSQRYAAVLDEPILREARLQDTKNRQNSIETNEQELRRWWLGVQSQVSHLASEVYQEALERGIAKEVARSVLPEGNTPSTLYMAGNVRSWIHYIQLRTANGTQKEHREIALECKRVLLEQFPSLQEVLNV